MWTYRPRGLERRLPPPSDSVKVVVLEGARAVGKTRLVRHLVEEARFRSYSDLSQPTTRLAAERDLEGWLRSLPTPAVVDEAQLMPGLPLAVKRIVDERPATLQFVLTGSASIGRSGLGGADPLSGRADRLVLRTFTESERRGLKKSQPSLMDVLFEGTPVAGFQGASTDDATLLERIERGGLPEFALGTSDGTRRASRIREDVLDALGRELQPDERFDAARVRDVLDAVVRAPGRILNMATLGQGLQMDRRTVDRYLAVLERRFLLLRLPNLALSPTTQTGSRAKAHAFDVAVAAESLRRAGVDPSRDRERFGQLIESWVAQQVTSASSWSSLSVDAFHWRRNRPSSEVDIVLADDRGRLVGIEVKAARELRSSDTHGLRALAAERGIHRGYIVYLGDTVVSLGDEIWGIPISALEAAEGFTMPQLDSPDRSMSSAAPHRAVDASIFFSYAHADDEYLGGSMLRFADALRDSYSFLFGGEIDIFTDRDGLPWGTAWRGRIDAAARDTQFFLAMVTPRYLRSEACRHEFEQFLSTTGEARKQLVLSLVWTPLPAIVGNDPVREHIDSHQWKAAGDLASLIPGSPGYRAATELLATALHEVIVKREQDDGPRDSTPAGSDEVDLAKSMAEFEQIRPEFDRVADHFGAAMNELGQVFESNCPFNPTPEILERLGVALSRPVKQVEYSTAELNRLWTTIERVFAAVVAMAPYIPEGVERDGLRRAVVELRVSLQIPGLEESEQIIGLMSSISRHLRPTSRALADAIRVLRTMQRSVEDWGAQLR